MIEMPASTPISRARVLIVEDDWHISGLLNDLLEGYGCEVVGPARDIAKAIHLASAENFDAALLDIDVGGKPGYAIAEALRKRKIPFAFITGQRRSQIDGRFSRQPLLQKPFRGRDVSRLLESMLRKPQH